MIESRFVKLLMVVLLGGLMVVFILPPAVTNMLGQGVVAGDVGTAFGEPITAEEVQQAKNVWDFAQRLVVPAGQLEQFAAQARGESTQFVSYPVRMIATALDRLLQPGMLVYEPRDFQSLAAAYQLNAELLSDPVLVHLLLVESAEQGVGQAVSPTEIADLLSTVQFVRTDGQGGVRRVDITEQTLTPAEWDSAQYVAAMLIRVRRAFEQDMNFVKVTTPMVNRQLARDPQVQTLRLTYAVRDADAYLQDVPQPTDEQLRELFERYNDVPGGEFDEDTNPMGLGYRLPDRIKFTALTVRPSQVRQAVEASRPREVWLDAAAEYFLENVEQFDVQQPTTAPSAMSLQQQIDFLAAYFGDDAEPQPPATQPTTQPAEQTIAQQALEAVLQERTDEQLRQITANLRSTLQQDYDAYRVSLRQNAEPPVTRLGVPYTDPGYLEALVAQIENRFGVRPEIGDFTDRFYGPEALAQLPFADAVAARGELPFARYAIERTSAFMAQTRDAAGLDTLQPSPVFQGVDQLLIYRLNEAAVNEPATDFAAAREQVAQDWRRLQAYDIALQRAQALVEKAAGGSLAQAADTVRTVANFPSNLFEPDAAPMLPGIDIQTPEGLAVLRSFAENVYEMLAGLQTPPTDQTPLRTFGLPRARLAIAAQLDGVDPKLSQADALLARTVIVENAIAENTLRNIYLNWFTPEAIKERTAYAPAAGEADEEAAAATTATP